jgi:uncharacterized protein (TIGR03435 family)
LLQLAFFTRHIDQLPDWARDDRFDITAAIAAEDSCRWTRLSPTEQARPLQAVLRDRFHLQSHYETRTLPGFALVVAKGGPKFKLADPSKPCADCANSARFDSLIHQPHPELLKHLGLAPLSGHILSMKEVAEFLSLAVGTPVVDQTGLTGAYRMNNPGFSYMAAGARDPMQADGSLASIDTSSIADDLKPRLGLDLKYGAKIPVEFFILDHIDPPSEN